LLSVVQAALQHQQHRTVLGLFLVVQAALRQQQHKAPLGLPLALQAVQQQQQHHRAVPALLLAVQAAQQQQQQRQHQMRPALVLVQAAAHPQQAPVDLGLAVQAALLPTHLLLALPPSLGSPGRLLHPHLG
jgi:hypothetical protein